MNLSVLRNALQDSVKRISVLAVLLTASALTAHAQAVFSPAVKVSHDIDGPGEPQMAVDSAGNINIVWSDETTPCTSASCVVSILFSRSTDGGATFSAPVNVSNGQGNSLAPQIALDPNGNINVIWYNYSPTYSAVFFSRSTDAGNTFSAPSDISAPAGGVLPPERRQIAVDSSGNINVAWAGTSSGIFFTRSINGGSTFSAPLTVASGINSPSIALDSAGGINIVGEASVAGHNPYDVFFTRSTDGGLTFSAPKDISNLPDGALSEQVAVAPDGAINVIWNSNCPYSYVCPAYPSSAVFFAQSKDNGATFSAPVNLSNTFAPGVSSSGVFVRDVRMALDPKGNIDLVWPEDNTSGVVSAFFSRSTDGGATFSAPQQIVTGFPNQMAVDTNGGINIVVSSTNGVSVVRSTDGGGTFSSTNVSGSAASPQAVELLITTDPSGKISVAWPNYDYNASKWGIFFSRGTAISLAALGLSPAHVTGGSSPTGTVTMNGPAPTGGAVVSLSSSDPSVSLPATVTIPEGTTSATFAVMTTPVAAKTAAVIMAAFSGVTQTASIAVEPPTLTSVTLNPSNTTAGSSSTGTVTLNGPAPAGGVVVALSSSNTSVARVQSSVTVPAGFTNTTFTVNTRMARCSNSAKITGSSSGVSQTASLAVMPSVPVPSQACTVIGRRGRTTFGRLQ